MKHTPTPWTAIKSKESASYPTHIRRIYFDEQKRRCTSFLADVHQCGEMSLEDANDNAAFIVEACNNHDALEAENARLREALEEISKIKTEYHYCKAIEKASKALEWK